MAFLADPHLLADVGSLGDIPDIEKRVGIRKWVLEDSISLPEVDGSLVVVVGSVKELGTAGNG